jgi:hypothetical protein
MTVTYPILMNAKALAPGDELLVYKPRGEKRPAAIKEISITDLAKRAKLSTSHP